MLQLKNLVLGSAKAVQDFFTIKTEIGGGMHPKAAQLWAYLLSIQNGHGIEGDCLEIGCFKGWGSYLPARLSQPHQKVVLVDIAQHHLNWSKDFLLEQKVASAERIESVLVDSAAGLGLREHLPATRRLRWIHVDGEHSYMAVWADLDSVALYAERDAVICVDDVDHPLAPGINDAMLDWLRRNKGWRLLARGFNKAYIVSSRANIRWFDYLSFLPDVFERYYESSILLASQTGSADTPYYSYGNPFDANKYLRVNNTAPALEDYEGYNPRSFLIGESRRPSLLVFGNCQMGVLHGALVQAASLCGFDVEFKFVRDVQDMTQDDVEPMRAAASASVGLVCQKVAGDKFYIRTDEFDPLVRTPLRIIVPSMHFNAYWPNHADLQMTPDSAQCMPTDSLIYLGVVRGMSDEGIAKLLGRSDLYAAPQIKGWVQQALDRLRARESQNDVSVLLSDFLAGQALDRRLFYLFNHPVKAVLDHILRGVLRELAKIFTPRRLDVYDKIQRGELLVGFDMSAVDFMDILPLPSVAAALGWKRDEDPAVYKYFRPRWTHGVHRISSVADEIRSVRERLARLSETQKAFNMEQIKTTSLQPNLTW